MDGTPLKKLARDLDLPVKRLTIELKAIGIDVEDEDTLISGQQQLELSKQLRVSQEKEFAIPDEITLDAIESANDLRELNQMLTRAMADRTIQPLIKDENLNVVIDTVFDLNVDTDQELLTAAILGRLAAVARGREKTVYERVFELFTDEPASIETLDDGDAKYYAASVLTHCDDHWVSEYSYRESVLIDTSDNARRELLSASLAREGSITSWLASLSQYTGPLRQIENKESRYRRVRRIASAVFEVAEQWRGQVGDNPGEQLSALMKSLFSSSVDNVDLEILVDAVDSLLSVLRRIIELRFSVALYPEVYAIILDARHTVGAGLWGRVLDQSEAITDVRHAMLEASLVLARQDRYDNDMLEALHSAFSSRARMTAAIKRYFAEAKDLDSSVSEWWCKGGGGDGEKEQKAQRIRNSEDEKISELLLKVEESEIVIEKLRSAVLPILQSMNPVLAKTVSKAATDYRETAQIVRSLARMRNLKTAGLMSERMEYNKRRHDMEGGHRSGIRYIKVIRDGVDKNFAGKTRMLVKPIVVPEE